MPVETVLVRSWMEKAMISKSKKGRDSHQRQELWGEHTLGLSEAMALLRPGVWTPTPPVWEENVASCYPATSLR